MTETKGIRYRSTAVTAKRNEPKDSLDYFPTPPWATRALLEHVLDKKKTINQKCLEPACGEGHMSKVLKDYFSEVHSSDIYPYGYGKVENYLEYPIENNYFDWIITNPPFTLSEKFILKSLDEAKEGVAILARTVFIESIGRYCRLFRDTPMSKFAQFVERVPMVKGRLDRKASSATGYAWLIWKKDSIGDPKLIWIPPCRKELERDEDYLIKGDE